MVRIKMDEDRMGNTAVLEGEAAIIISTEKARNEKGTRIVIAGEMDSLNFSGLFGQAVREALKTIAANSIFPEDLLMDIFLVALKNEKGDVR